MSLSRRDFLKAHAVAAAASVSGIPVKTLAADPAKESDIKWDKAVCRFCSSSSLGGSSTDSASKRCAKRCPRSQLR